jgi:hypothetical protein
MSSLNITAQQILDNRKARKDAGLVGCISGRPVPALDFFGYRDVQIWFYDANGKLNGDPGFDRKNPMCFCFDCRSAFDPDGTVDLELVLNGHGKACATYTNILIAEVKPAKDEQVAQPSKHATVPLPPRTETCVPAPRPSPVLTGIPTSLPPPRPRDLHTESFETRYKTDLAILRGEIQRELVVTMDKRRMLTSLSKEERTVYLKTIDEQEQALWRKMDALDILLG